MKEERGQGSPLTADMAKMQGAARADVVNSVK